MAREKKINKWLKTWGAFLAPVLVALIALIPGLFKTESPQFIVESPIVRIGAPIIIKAANGAADQEGPLDVDFDKHRFEKAGEPFKKGDDIRRWKFNILNHNPTPEMVTNNSHILRFGLNGGPLSQEEHAVSFIKKGEKIPHQPGESSPSRGSSRSTILLLLVILAIIIVVAALSSRNK